MLAAWNGTDETGQWESFVALSAGPFPGLVTLDNGGRYIYINGTSMASPQAAGVAALVKEVHPEEALSKNC